MKSVHKILLIALVLAVSVAVLPVLGLPYAPLRVTAQTLDSYLYYGMDGMGSAGVLDSSSATSQTQ